MAPRYFALAVLSLMLLLAGCRSKNRFTGSAPTVPDPKVGDIGDTAAVVFWTTDLPATSVVEFGASESYGAFAGDEITRTATHRVSLSALGAASDFHYRVRSLDERGNTLFSFDRTFRTRPAGQTAGSFPIGENFEGTGASAWTPQTFTDSQAVTAVQSAVAPDDSHGTSLMLTMNLVPNDLLDHLTKGEALVSFRDIPGVSMDFADLSGRTATVFIYASTGSVGDPSKPNFVQLFVKDVSGRSHYSAATNIVENSWFQVSFTLTSVEGFGEFMDPGFDPAYISLGGIKVGGGGGSTVSYAGPIFVDDVVFRP